MGKTKPHAKNIAESIMSRSTYIYIVILSGNIHGAYTVRYQMEDALPKNNNGVTVLRLRDNDNKTPPTDITQELYGNTIKNTT